MKTSLHKEESKYPSLKGLKGLFFTLEMSDEWDSFASKYYVTVGALGCGDSRREYTGLAYHLVLVP